MDSMTIAHANYNVHAMHACTNAKHGLGHALIV